MRAGPQHGPEPTPQLPIPAPRLQTTPDHQRGHLTHGAKPCGTGARRVSPARHGVASGRHAETCPRKGIDKSTFRRADPTHLTQFEPQTSTRCGAPPRPEQKRVVSLPRFSDTAAKPGRASVTGPASSAPLPGKGQTAVVGTRGQQRSPWPGTGSQRPRFPASPIVRLFAHRRPWPSRAQHQ